MKVGGAAGVATLSVAGVEVAQEVLGETKTAILPLVPYLDGLPWVFGGADGLYRAPPELWIGMRFDRRQKRNIAVQFDTHDGHVSVAFSQAD